MLIQFRMAKPLMNGLFFYKYINKYLCISFVNEYMVLIIRWQPNYQTLFWDLSKSNDLFSFMSKLHIEAKSTRVLWRTFRNSLLWVSLFSYLVSFPACQYKSIASCFPVNYCIHYYFRIIYEKSKFDIFFRISSLLNIFLLPIEL